MVVPSGTDGLPPAEPPQLRLKLLEENTEPERVIAELRVEIVRRERSDGRGGIILTILVPYAAPHSVRISPALTCRFATVGATQPMLGRT